MIGVLTSSTASYSCNTGYILNLLNGTAEAVRVCQGPDWIPSAPTCGKFLSL